VSYTAYMADQAACDTAIIATIAETVSSVKYLTVTGASRRLTSTIDSSVAGMHLRAATKVRVSATAESVFLQYYVVVPGRYGTTYQELSDSLTGYVENGRFTDVLRYYTNTTPAPALVNASSDSVQTEEVFPGDESNGSDGNSTTLSIGAVVGIAIGGFAALLILVYLSFCLCKTRPESSDNGKDFKHLSWEPLNTPDN